MAQDETSTKKPSAKKAAHEHFRSAYMTIGPSKEAFPRFMAVETLQTTLQGYLAKAYDNCFRNECVVKVSSKELIRKGSSLDGGTVPEDFKREIKILHYLTQNRATGVCRFIQAWETQTDLYMAMEYCKGGDLFDYVVTQLHKNPALGPRMSRNLSNRQLESIERHFLSSNPKYWYPRFGIIHQIFVQLVNVLYSLHEELGIAHLDMSLENVMISHVNENGVPIIKVIDFGVAVVGDAKRGIFFNKNVGKTYYQPKEVRMSEKSRIPYDAKLADVWCLGIMLFMMLFCQHPFPCADEQHIAYATIIKGHLKKVLMKNKKMFLLTEESCDAMVQMLRPPKERITTRQLFRHPFYLGVAMKTTALPVRVQSKKEQARTGYPPGMDPLFTPSHKGEIVESGYDYDSDQLERKCNYPRDSVHQTRD